MKTLLNTNLTMLTVTMWIDRVVTTDLDLRLT